MEPGQGREKTASLDGSRMDEIRSRPVAHFLKPGHEPWLLVTGYHPSGESERPCKGNSIGKPLLRAKLPGILQHEEGDFMSPACHLLQEPALVRGKSPAEEQDPHGITFWVRARPSGGSLLRGRGCGPAGR